MGSDWGPPPDYSSQPPPSQPPPQQGWGQPPPGAWGGPPQPQAPVPMPGPVPVRPMGLGEIIDGAFRLLRADIGPILLTVAAVVIPTQILLFIIGASVIGSLGEFLQQAQEGATLNPGQVFGVLGNLLQRLPALLGVVALQSFLLMLAAAAVTRIGGARYFGVAQRPVEALAAAGRSVLSLLGANILTGLVIAAPIVIVAILIALGFALDPTAGGIAAILVIPAALFAIYLAIALTFRVPAVMMESAGPVRALQRSQRLVSGRWWPTFGALLVSGIILYLVQIALTGVLSAVSAAMSLEVQLILQQIGTALAQIVTVPAQALIVLMLYLNARVSSEGLDLELRNAGGGPG